MDYAEPLLAASTDPALTAQCWADFHFGAGAKLAASIPPVLGANADPPQCQHRMRTG